MAAQLGDAITLDYQPQGTQQLGDAITLEYQVEVVVPPRRFISAAVSGRWARAKGASHTTAAVTPRTQLLDGSRKAPWVIGRPLQRAPVIRWGVGARRDRTEVAPWRVFERRMDGGHVASWIRGLPRDDRVHAPWGRYERQIQPVEHTTWLRALPRDDQVRAPWGRSAARDPSPTHGVMPRVVDRDLDQWVPWTRYSRVLQPGWGVVTPPGPTPNPDGTWVVPIRQVYTMLNEASLLRVSDGAVVPTTQVSISLDSSLWTWSFSATVPYSANSLVERGTELQAAVNGDLVRLVVRSKTRSRAFGKDWLTVTGVGRAAVLASPYSPVLSFGNLGSMRTAQQLAYDALLDNGVPLDWAIDWQLDDWNVPAGAWSLQGSRMDALQAIAAAAGGYVQPHMVDQVVRVLHKYPVAPWAWGDVTPDYELPVAVVTQEGIEWSEKAVYNRVFVSGQSQGVLGQVTREGTAGDLVAEMITDSLVTDTPVVRQRGRAELADTGNQALVTLRMPVFDDAGGVIVPGKFVKYVDGSTTRIGIVRGLQVDIGKPEVWQTIKVETHE